MDDIKTINGKMETLKHIAEVQRNLWTAIEELDRRAKAHDQSKLESPEAEIFGEFTPELEKTVYGSPEYEALKLKVKVAIDHHYANNDHHTEHHKDGIDDMDLFQITEMLCDWKAACKRNKNGNIRQSLDVNATKYKISDQLMKILENTVMRYY